MKRLGQYFLVNQDALFRIAKALELRGGEMVVEIGPGHGELTRELKNQNAKIKIIAIEKDEELAFSLRRLALNNVEIVEGDALKLLPEVVARYKIQDTRYKIVGNIPYYITGHLLRTIGDLEHKPALSVLTIQREVAERLVSGPPHMNQLAASVQFWGIPTIIGHLSPQDFHPAPKVHSSTVKIVPKKPAPTKKEADSYYRALKILFRQPRKTILNNVMAGSEQTVDKSAVSKMEISARLEKLGINPLDRPQNLTVHDIIKISGLLTPEPAV